MRYAVLGDVHSNVSALKAVLKDARAVGVDRFLCVGDVVGYGAAPLEAIALLRELDCGVVKGNHDAAVTGELNPICFNPMAREAVAWTKEQISEDDLEWLKGLPMVLHVEHASVAHGTFDKPEQFKYVMATEDADPSLDAQPLPVCFVGHTHVPVSILRLQEDPDRTCYTLSTRVDLGETDRALCNVGSVGQPRDEIPAAAWGLFDATAQRLDIRRVEYDVQREANRIREAGLPQFLADRLFLGV
jgi:diadenosine tetraphosphatase ApaH/serine/threonine PP2A family protein phosphatase